MNYFIETVHGVLIDSVNNLPRALQIAKGRDMPFRAISCRVYHCVGQNKVYIGGIYGPEY